MLDACGRIAIYIDGWDLIRFESDLRTIDAVCMNLIRIGEGARLLSAEMKARAPDVRWRQIIDMRNFIAHTYALIESDTVWSSASLNVPELAKVLRRLRAHLEP